MVKIEQFYKKDENKFELKIKRDGTAQHSHISILKNGIEIGYFHFVPSSWKPGTDVIVKFFDPDIIR
jgi:hypothetical protein